MTEQTDPRAVIEELKRYYEKMLGNPGTLNMIANAITCIEHLTAPVEDEEVAEVIERLEGPSIAFWAHGDHSGEIDTREIAALLRRLQTEIAQMRARLRVLGYSCEDEGCPHFNKPHSHPKEPGQ